MTSKIRFAKDVNGQVVEIVDRPYSEIIFPNCGFVCKQCGAKRATVRDIEYHCSIAHGIRKEIVQVR